MTNDLAARLAFVREMPRHLSVLTQYASRSITRADLLRVEQTAQIRDQLCLRPEGPRSKLGFAFDEKTGPEFAEFLDALHAARPDPVEVWIKTTTDCGLLVLDSLKYFNIDFNFATDPNGVVTLRNTDHGNEIVLDYFEEADRRLLELEVSGADWLPLIALRFRENLE